MRTRYSKDMAFPSRFILIGPLTLPPQGMGGIHVSQRDDKPTQFERAMSELGIRLIFADSP